MHLIEVWLSSRSLRARGLPGNGTPLLVPASEAPTGAFFGETPGFP